MALTKAHNRMIEGATVNVKDFGAVGDGVTDDSAAIQAAIDYAGTLSEPSVVYAPQGIYLLNSTLKVLYGRAKLDIQGTLLLNGASGTAGIQIGDGSNKVDYSYFKIFRIDGQDYTQGRDGIQQRWSILNTFEVNSIVNCRYGNHYQQISNNAVYIHCNHYFQEIRSGDKGIYFENDAGGISVLQNEGHVFNGGQIVSQNVGIEFGSATKAGGCFFYISAVDCRSTVGSTDYINNMDYTQTSGNMILSYIPAANNPNIYMEGDTHIQVNNASYMFFNGVELIGQETFNPMRLKPVKATNNGLQLAGDQNRNAGGSVVVYGSTHASNAAEVHINTANSASAAVERLVIGGGSDQETAYFNDTDLEFKTLGGRVGRIVRSGAATRYYTRGGPEVFWTSSSGSPEGVITANVGAMYTRTDGGAGTTLYVKESGTGNTGWVAK